MSLQEIIEGYRPAIEAELKALLESPGEAVQPFYGMMHYHLGWAGTDFQSLTAPTGKRLRPVLCLLCCEAAGGVPDLALPAAAAVELVHNFSLVHDDIQDQSLTRRHRTTVWAVWGAAQAINVGDGLYSLAYLALHRLSERGVPAQRVLDACCCLAATCLALCEGQYLDMSFESRAVVSQAEYLEMIRRKTAALLACSCKLGGLVAGADTATIAHLHRFGECLGMAFQVQDDILGIWGEEAVTGKPAADDIRQHKKTLPIVYALEQGEDQETLRRLLQEDPMREETVWKVVAMLDAAEARRYATELAAEYHRRALAELDPLPATPARERLCTLAEELLTRSY